MPGFEGNNAEDRCAPLVCLLTMVRNCDLLLNYVRHRMTRIEQVGAPVCLSATVTSSPCVRRRAQARWQIAGRLPPQAEAKLSQSERTYAERYDELLSDLQAAAQRPPSARRAFSRAAHVHANTSDCACAGARRCSTGST